jgi:hypothetical protein
MIVKRHKEVILYQDVQDFSSSVFAQQVPLITDIQKQFSTVINLVLPPQAQIPIRIPINLPYTIVNTVVYIQNLQLDRVIINTIPDSLILFTLVSTRFYELSRYTNVTIPVYGHEEISSPILMTGAILMLLQNMSLNTVTVFITIEGLYSLYNLAQISPFIYKIVK